MDGTENRLECVIAYKKVSRPQANLQLQQAAMHLLYFSASKRWQVLGYADCMELIIHSYIFMIFL